jgi:hypothetical protein
MTERYLHEAIRAGRPRRAAAIDPRDLHDPPDPPRPEDGRHDREIR